jgi:hypothetical protein
MHGSPRCQIPGIWVLRFAAVDRLREYSTMCSQKYCSDLDELER